MTLEVLLHKGLRRAAPCLPPCLPCRTVGKRWSLWAHLLYMSLGTGNVCSALLSPLVKSWQTQGGTQGEVGGSKSYDFLVGTPRIYLWEFKSVGRIINRRELKKIKSVFKILGPPPRCACVKLTRRN